MSIIKCLLFVDLSDDALISITLTSLPGIIVHVRLLLEQALSPKVKMQLTSWTFRPVLIACTLLATVFALASAKTVSSTILVFARNSAEATSGTSGLKAYGIPYQLVLVPQNGITLPTLSSSTVGNYGGIVILSEVSYEYSTGWASGITAAQWQTIYNYQVSFGVRIARLDVYPGSDFGTFCFHKILL